MSNQQENQKCGKTKRGKDRNSKSAGCFAATARKVEFYSVCWIWWVGTHALLHLKTAHALIGAMGFGTKLWWAIFELGQGDKLRTSA
jgi:hypothetical protein